MRRVEFLDLALKRPGLLALLDVGDAPVDRRGPRERLLASLDAMFAETFPAEELLDAVESKLFGIGSECYVAGSHEFYLGYAASRQELQATCRHVPLAR